MYEITVAVTCGLILIGTWIRTYKDKEMYKDQRDALLGLLDSEGRGQQALEVIKWYRR